MFLLNSKTVDLWSLAERRHIIAGKCQLTEMQRLRSSLVNDEGDVEVELEFGIDDSGIRFVKGVVSGGLLLQCQRCMEPMVFNANLTLSLGIVCDVEHAMTLPDQYEPLVFGEAQVSLCSLIEDELILSLPLVAKHPGEGCSLAVEQDHVDSDDLTQKENPFAVLKTLKN